jgi:putative lipase involved disintegration of autophagic bodies
MQLNDCTGDNSSSLTVGFLPALVGEGSECHGYKIRVVGHSLGGSVATVLGMMVMLAESSPFIFSIACCY